jgi:uncharacterized protein YndB with AHSA1/START domain
VSDGTLELTRIFNAPVHDLFRAWIEPARLAEWLATRAEVDPRVGGHYRLESDGDESAPGVHVCHGEYLEFVPDRRIVKSWIYEGPNPADTTRSRVSVDFTAADDHTTEIRFREEGQGLGTDEEREFSRRAWSTAFDELERALAT